MDDTTSAPTGVNDPTGNGPIWAYDTVQRQVTWTPDTATPGAWDTTVATFGTYQVFANPITGAPWKGACLMAGEIQYAVTAPTVPLQRTCPRSARTRCARRASWTSRSASRTAAPR